MVIPLFFSPENSILTLPYSRTHPLNPLHRLHNFLHSSQKREMSQSRVGESSNSFNNNSFNNNTHTFNNTNSLNNTIDNTINNSSNADERDKILSWLSPLEPRIRHHDIRAQRIEHVGDWLLRTEEYQNWLDGIQNVEPGCSALLCYGGPGVGKTYIT